MDKFVEVRKQMLIDEAMVDKELGRWGVHETHCCPKHGCKYGDDSCPVMLGLTNKHNENCEGCENDRTNPDPLDLIEAYLIKDIERAKSEYHHLWGAAPEDGAEAYNIEITLEVVRSIRKFPIRAAKKAREEGWWK